MFNFIFIIAVLYLLSYIVGVFKVRRIRFSEHEDPVWVLHRLSVIGWLPIHVDYYTMEIGIWSSTTTLWSHSREVIVQFSKKCRFTDCLFKIMI